MTKLYWALAFNVLKLVGEIVKIFIAYHFVVKYW